MLVFRNYDYKMHYNQYLDNPGVSIRERHYFYQVAAMTTTSTTSTTTCHLLNNYCVPSLVLDNLSL